MDAFFYPSNRGINFAKIRGNKITDYNGSKGHQRDEFSKSCDEFSFGQKKFSVIILCSTDGVSLKCWRNNDVIVDSLLSKTRGTTDTLAICWRCIRNFYYFWVIISKSHYLCFFWGGQLP